MMSKPTLLTALALSLTLLPLTAQAQGYVDPQEALSGDQFVDGFLVPPNSRAAERRVAEQRARSLARRQAEQEATFGGGAVAEDSSSGEPTHAAAGDEEPASPELVDVLTSIEQTLSDIKNDSVESQTQRRERALARLEALEIQREAQAAGGAAYLNGGQALHGGAPLAPTGPETWISGGALALAVTWTLWQSRREAKR